MSAVRIKFKHYRTGEVITEEGWLPPNFNNEGSDKYVLMVGPKKCIDIIKKTVISMEKIDGYEKN